MKRKREEKSPAVAVTDEFKTRVSKTLEKFRESKKKKYTFGGNLTGLERHVVHETCQKLGLDFARYGKQKLAGRCVIVYNKGNKLKSTSTIGWRVRQKNKKMIKKMEVKKENLAHLTFSEEGKAVLQNLFMYYPPDDGEMEKKMMEIYSGKNAKRRCMGDDMFRNPSLGKEEIAKKLETLNSKMEQDAKLRMITEVRSKLPIASFKNDITSAVESNQVVLISGETGCGKTTQVPQYLLDHMWGKGETCKIVCTQPRRISATSVAERISAERGETIGDDIGYTIRLDRTGGKHSSVVFCTNGVLLQVLVSRDNVSHITHIIVDEIHERDRFSDFMLAILRDMLPSYPHLRLILMSATLDAERFSMYFGGCPIIRVPGKTYPVTAFYLEDVLSILKPDGNKNLDSDALTVPTKGPKLREEVKVALDEAINLAWSDDEFGPLLDFVFCEGYASAFNYQHSLTGLTPLMVFAGKGRVGEIYMLLSLGVDCTLKAKDGRTAFELAVQENQPESADVIKRHMEGSNNVNEQQLLEKYLKSANPMVIDAVLLLQLLKKICSSSEAGAILVFLPGWDDINKLRDRLLADPFFKNASEFMILPLHSMVPQEDQKLVFKRPDAGCRKIVLSTNMAETSITIDDIVYVIDSGRMKEKNYDPVRNVCTLQTSWVSKANAKQRAGRAGRCQPGICYHLYSKSQAASLPDFQTPELRRVPLEELCLQVKLIDPTSNIAAFLRKTMDPPDDKTISNAVVVLQNVGALTADEELTELGEKLGSLPVHPLTSRMLFFAIMLKCLDPALTLACASDLRDPFILPMTPEGKQEAADGRNALASLYGGQSDQLALVAAFDCFQVAKEKGLAREFCSKFFISYNTMRMLSGMRKKLLSELIRQGFVPEDISSCNFNARDQGILRAVLVAYLYPLVGKLRPPHRSGKRLVEIANGETVKLQPRSTNHKLLMQAGDHRPIFVFDEIVRGDFGTLIRKCTVIRPLPLLLLATDISVSPGNDDKASGADKKDDKNDHMEIDAKVGAENVEKIEPGTENEEKIKPGAENEDKIKPGAENEDKIMSSPDNSVIVHVDGWLPFKSTALEVAQIYCLRDRLAAAILFTATNPRRILPPVLAFSVSAIAFILSYDALCGDSKPLDSAGAPKPAGDATDINKSADAPKSTGDATEISKSVDVPKSTGGATEINMSVDAPKSTGDATEINMSVEAPTSTGDATEINKSADAPKLTGNATEINESADAPKSTGNDAAKADESASKNGGVAANSLSEFLASLLSSENLPGSPIDPLQVPVVYQNPPWHHGPYPQPQPYIHQNPHWRPHTNPQQQRYTRHNPHWRRHTNPQPKSCIDQNPPSHDQINDQPTSVVTAKKKKKKNKKKGLSEGVEPPQTSASMKPDQVMNQGDPSQSANPPASEPTQTPPAKKPNVPSQNAKPPSSKPPAKPLSLVGYGSNRFGPYGLRGGSVPAKRQRRGGGGRRK